MRPAIECPACAQAGPLWKRLLALVLPAVTLWILHFPFHAAFTSPGTGFFAGDWTGRVLDRVLTLPGILGRMGIVLLDPAWLGVWILFLAALAWAVLQRGARRHKPAILLAGTVLAQLGVYAFVYLATYLDPVATSTARSSASRRLWCRWR